MTRQMVPIFTPSRALSSRPRHRATADGDGGL